MSETATDIVFSAEIPAKRLKHVFDCISVLVDECKIGIGSKGITVKANDEANVGVLNLNLSHEAFTRYSADNTVIAFDLEYLNNALGMVEGDETVNLEADKHRGELEVTTTDLDCTVPLISPDNLKQGQVIPNLDLTTEVHLRYDQFHRGIKAAEMARETVDAEEVSFIVTEGCEEFIVDTERDLNEISVHIDAEDLVDISGKPTQSKYSIGYMSSIREAMPNEAEIELKFKGEYPMRIEFDVADGNGSATYMIAPRLDPDV